MKKVTYQIMTREIKPPVRYEHSYESSVKFYKSEISYDEIWRGKTEGQAEMRLKLSLDEWANNEGIKIEQDC